MPLASLVLLLVTFPVFKVTYKPFTTITLRAVKRLQMVFAFTDKDSYLGTPAVLVSLLEMLFPQIRAGTPPPRSGLCWNVTYLATSYPCPPVGNGILPPPAGHVCPSPQSHCPRLRSVHFAISLRPRNVSPTKAGLGHFCSSLSPPAWGGGGRKGTLWRRQEEEGGGTGSADRKRPPSQVWGPSSVLCPESGVLSASHGRIHR